MSVTVNSFPPFQSMNSPRGWALAIIVLLHAVFFWLFASGMGTRMIAAIQPKISTVIDVPPVKESAPAEQLHDLDVKRFITDPIYVPEPDDPLVDNPTHDATPIQQMTSELPPGGGSGVQRIEQPAIEVPMIDPRTPLSEPEYPANEIRQGHTGTVLLSIYVLETGRVGDVRIERSSGFARLDSAAAKEARRWRLKPGSQDGRPVAMWKSIPITFQLKK